MSDDEDDYLSDKFLVQATSSSSTSSSFKTYTERRKEEQRRAALRNEQNRKRSRRELEEESRAEGLSTSLFERAKEDAGEDGAPKNKALAMMMKMGFKPGQALGQSSADEEAPSSNKPEIVASAHKDNTPEEAIDETTSRGRSETPSHAQHRTVPLPLNEWAGKKGIGLGSKRAASPSAAERIAKMAKMAEDRDHSDFRDRARQQYEERRAEGRLGPAQRTCVTLDEKAGREFNVLWLNPNNAESFPEGLIDALEDPDVVYALQRQQHDNSIEGRLKARMKVDALQPLTSSLEDEEGAEVKKPALNSVPYSEEDLKEAAQFLRLGAADRLQLVSDYLRRRYAYCFWCGTDYEGQEDMEKNCPGPDEEAHD